MKKTVLIRTEEEAVKKTVLIYLAVALGVFAPATVQAAGGTATVPYVNSYFASGTDMLDYYLLVSNITDNSISLSIALYQADGCVIQDGDNNPSQGTVRGYLSYSNYVESPSTNKTVSFDVGAHHTGGIHLRFTNPDQATWSHGYGTIEWTQNSNVTHGAVASILMNVNSGGINGMPIILVNCGNPF